MAKNAQNWPLMSNLTPESNSMPKITLENGLRCYFIKSYHQKATKCTYRKISRILLIQGDPLQTVKSNLDLTERKHAINFNLKVDSDQGRLGI